MGSNTPNRNRNARSAAEQALVDGLGKHATAIPAIVISGAPLTTKDLVAILQARIDSARSAQSTRAAWLTAVQADQDERARTQAVVSGLEQILLVAFAGQVDALADFRLVPRKLRVVTPEQKLAAAARAQATRAARHTMGKKQKAAITGTVPPTAPVTPPTAGVPTGTAVTSAPAATGTVANATPRS